MKRALIIGLALAAFASAGIAYAQTNTSSSDAPPLPTFTTPTAPSVTEPTITQNADGSYTATTPASGQSGTGAGPGTNGDPSAAFGWLLGGIMTIFAWLAGTAGVVLNDTVYYTVVQMGNVVNPNNLNAIGVSWRILRDLGNIVLIFGFLAVGISTIVGYTPYGVSKRLPMLLIVAIFINFSLFATEAVIDIGNLFATEFYTQINGGGSPSVQGVSSANPQDPINGGISGTIMNSLSLQTMYNINQSNANGINGNLTDSKVMLVGILGTILFLVLAFVLFTLAIILIVRFVTLVLLMIVAPIGFAGLVVPGLESTAKGWWKTLFGQVVTAPALLLMLYVALAVITDAKFLTGFGANGGNYTAIANGSASSGALDGYAGLLLAFIVAMGLLLACVVLAKRMSAFGADFATKWAGRATGGFVGYELAGGTALAGRFTLGLGGRLLNNKRMQAAASKGGVTGTFAKIGAFTGRNLENRTYDIRNSKIAQGAGRALVGALATGGTGFESVAAGTGKGATITAKTAVDSTIKAYKEGILPVVSPTWWRNQQKEYEKSATELDRKDVFKAGVTADIKKEFKKMSADEITELKGIRQGLNNFVAALSPAQYTELQKSDKLLKGEKDKLKTTWEAQFAPATAAGTLARFSTEEIAGLSGDVLTKSDVVDNLKTTELDAIRRKGNLTKDQRHDIYTHIMALPAVHPARTEFVDSVSAAKDPRGERNRYWNV